MTAAEILNYLCEQSEEFCDEMDSLSAATESTWKREHLGTSKKSLEAAAYAAVEMAVICRRFPAHITRAVR